MGEEEEEKGGKDRTSHNVKKKRVSLRLRNLAPKELEKEDEELYQITVFLTSIHNVVEALREGTPKFIRLL